MSGGGWATNGVVKQKYYYVDIMYQFAKLLHDIIYVACHIKLHGCVLVSKASPGGRR